MEGISDADYTHERRVCKDFEITNLGEYHDLHIQSHTLLLADVFENFKMLLMVELEEEYVTLFIDMQKLIINT